jgi:YggT family protein
MQDPVMLMLNAFSVFLNIYVVLLIIRILLSWFPNINWFDPPFSILGQLTDPYLNIFRSIIPPLGGIDFSPMLAIILLQVLSSVVESLTQGARFAMYM